MITTKTHREILAGFFNKEVIIKPWSGKWNPKLQWAPHVKKGTITEIRNSTFLVHCAGLGETSFTSDQLLAVVKPISKITNEECVMISGILGGADHLSESSKINQVHNLLSSPNIYTAVTNISGMSWFYAFQFLQSQGYALPYMEHTVDELIKEEIYFLEQQ